MGVLGAVVAGVLIFWLTVGIDAQLEIKPPGIYEPTNGARVPRKVAVEGWYSEAEVISDLWLVVQPVESPYYHPQPGPIPKDKDGQWRGVVYVGESSRTNIGEEFLVFLLTTTPAASQVFTSYLRDSTRRNEWFGLQTLPNGATSIDSVKVVRK